MDTTIYHEMLQNELLTLTNELKSLGVQDPENTKDWEVVQSDEPEADENMVADHTESHVTNSAILADLETRYNNVVLALKKIEMGTYGICEVSGEPIELERLNANPAARTCITHIDTPVDLN